VRDSICRGLLTLLLTLLFLCEAYAADVSIQKVEISPLTGGVSFNTITLGTGWVTASTIIGRKEVCILNTSSSNNVYVTGVSGSTATGTIYPRESVTFKAGSNLRIYVSANTTTLIEVWEIR